jgi:hypothetical protein
MNVPLQVLGQIIRMTRVAEKLPVFKNAGDQRHGGYVEFLSHWNNQLF